MLGVPRILVDHTLNMDPKARPVKQPLRWFDEPKCKAIAAKLHRLETPGFIKEIKTSTWFSNPVIVPKGSLPTPSYRLNNDFMAGYTKLSFLDAYSSYNQIKLKVDDVEKTTFITPYGVFCYQVMPFGLKNAGATYQRMMQNCLCQ
jgi:hypothetical protein